MRTVRVQGVCLVGMEAEAVCVEARFDGHDRQGTEMVFSGLPDPVIRESRGRLLCALRENGLRIPAGVLTINLVPAFRRKVGGALDLPIALGAAAACGHLDPRWLRGILFLGELGIDGRLHAVPGGLAAAHCARRLGLDHLLAPEETARQAAWIEEVDCRGAQHLVQIIAHLSGAGPSLELPLKEPDPAPPTDVESLDDVRGQASAKRALAVAALGGHGLLLVGPPGAGKTMLAKRLVSLMPQPSTEERIEITLALAAAGQWPRHLANRRPFRAPHHTTSYAGLVGGGSPPRPGEITLAHCGLLFLDELPEFQRDSLEALRQPLESGQVAIGRAGSLVEFPARFQLAAAMNPCPCGYRGHPRLTCRCSRPMVERYRRRISGPLLDRIELCLELQPPSMDELLPSSGELRIEDEVRHERLLQSVEQGLERCWSRQGPHRNAQLSGDELDQHAALDGPSRQLLTSACEQLLLSARAIQGLRRVARTLADLAGETTVEARHLAEALGLRGGLHRTEDQRGRIQARPPPKE